MSYKVGYITAGTYKSVSDAHGAVSVPDVAFADYGWAQVKDNGNGTYCFRFIIDGTMDEAGFDSIGTPPTGVTDGVVAGVNDA